MKTLSIVKLLKELVSVPSQGGVDNCDRMIEVVGVWLRSRRVPFQLLHAPSGRAVAVVVKVTGAHPGPTYCLDACLDTATIGDAAKWSHPPFGAEEADGWLYGRGACDSKAAVAIFCHLAAYFQRRRSKLAGTLHILFDADEHTGRFGGVKEYLAQCAHPQGVIIGYPGNDSIASGARGFYRVEITVHGQAAHSGSSSSSGANAVVKAAKLAAGLGSLVLPPATAAVGFALPAKVTVTEIVGGSGYTAVPDLCRIKVDCRLTPTFQVEQARALIAEQVAAVEGQMPFPGAKPMAVVEEESWPAYALGSQSPLLAALSLSAEAVFGKNIPARVVGPSNIGNYLSSKGIDTVCGFGVTYRGLHANDECIELKSIASVAETYRRTVESLLAAAAN